MNKKTGRKRRKYFFVFSVGEVLTKNKKNQRLYDLKTTEISIIGNFCYMSNSVWKHHGIHGGYLGCHNGTSMAYSLGFFLDQLDQPESLRGFQVVSEQRDVKTS